MLKLINCNQNAKNTPTQPISNQERVTKAVLAHIETLQGATTGVLACLEQGKCGSIENPEVIKAIQHFKAMLGEMFTESHSAILDAFHAPTFSKSS